MPWRRVFAQTCFFPCTLCNHKCCIHTSRRSESVKQINYQGVEVWRSGDSGCGGGGG